MSKDLFKALEKISAFKEMSDIDRADVILDEEVDQILGMCADRIMYDTNMAQVMGAQKGAQKPDRAKIDFLSKDLKRKFGAAIMEWMRQWKRG